MADDQATHTVVRQDNTDTVARLAASRTKFRNAVKGLTAERDELKTTIADLTKKVADLEKAGGPEEIARLKTTIREAGHRARFNELARAAGARQTPAALADLWERSGYKADGDTPDDGQIKAAIEAQRTERDYLFEPAGEGDQGDQGGGNAADRPPEPSQAKPGPGRGQGGNGRATGSQMQVTDAQLRDPAWCMANAAKLAAVAKDVADLPATAAAGKFAIV